MANDAPIAIDFLSDPSGGITGTKQMELELVRITKRVETLTKAFLVLDGSISSGMVTKIANIANSTNRMQAGAQASAAAAQSLATSLAAVSNASGPLALITTELTALVSQLRSAGQAARNVRPGTVNTGAAAGTSGAVGGSNNFLIAGGLGTTITFAAVAAEAKRATGAAMDFEQAMAGVAAVGEIDRTTAEFRKLSAAVQEGSRQFTSLEKAGGLRELVAAGLSAEQATQALGTTLNLATAGEMSMGRAAEILTATMSMFKVEAKDSVKVIDAIVKASNLSLASVDSMGEAMKFIGPVASAMKLPLTEVSAALALLAKAGVQGGMAGRGLGAVFARIVAPSKEARDALKGFGMDANDLNPSLVGLETMIKRLGNLDQETLVKLFGAENLDISNTLALNAKEFSGLNDEMQNIAGTAQRFADTISNTTTGKLKELKNTLKEVESELGKVGIEFMKLAGNATKGTIFSPSNVLAGLQEFNRGPGDVGPREALDFEKRIKGAKSVAAVESIVSQIKARQLTLAEAIQAEIPKGIFSNSEMVDDLSKTIKALDRVRELAHVINAEGAPGRSAAAAKARAAIPFEGPSMSDRGAPIFGPQQGENTDTPTKIESKRKSMDSELKKSADIQKELVRKRAEFAELLAVEEAKAAGNNTLATKLQKELDLMREKSRLAKELGLAPEDAGNLAERLVNAQSKVKGKESNVVADSLQSIGGGGRFFGGDQSARILSDQLAEQQKIRAGIELLNTRIGNGNGVIKAGFN